MGVFPTLLNEMVTSQLYRTCQCYQDNKTIQGIIGDLTEQWNSCKELAMLRIVGMHQIINVVSKENELEWRKNFNISSRGDILEPTRSRNATEIHKTVKDSAKEPPAKNQCIAQKKIQKPAVRLGPTKLCQGVTCEPQLIHRNISIHKIFAIIPSEK